MPTKPVVVFVKCIEEWEFLIKKKKESAKGRDFSVKHGNLLLENSPVYEGEFLLSSRATPWQMFLY